MSIPSTPCSRNKMSTLFVDAQLVPTNYYFLYLSSSIFANSEATNFFDLIPYSS
jgi:hypothetical protein